MSILSTDQWKLQLSAVPPLPELRRPLPVGLDLWVEVEEALLVSMFVALASLGSLCLVVDHLTMVVDPLTSGCWIHADPFVSIALGWGFAPQSRCCLHSSSNLVVDDLVVLAALAAPIGMTLVLVLCSSWLSNQTSRFSLPTFALCWNLPAVPAVLRFALTGLFAATVWSA